MVCIIVLPFLPWADVKLQRTFGTRTLPTSKCSQARYTLITMIFISILIIGCQGARLREKAEKKDDEEDDEEESEDEDIEEELGYISALDSVNPYASFKQALTSTFRLVSWLHDFHLFLSLFPQLSRCKTARPTKLLPRPSRQNSKHY